MSPFAQSLQKSFNKIDKKKFGQHIGNLTTKNDSFQTIFNNINQDSNVDMFRPFDSYNP